MWAFAFYSNTTGTIYEDSMGQYKYNNMGVRYKTKLWVRDISANKSS